MGNKSQLFSQGGTSTFAGTRGNVLDDDDSFNTFGFAPSRPAASTNRGFSNRLAVEAEEEIEMDAKSTKSTIASTSKASLPSPTSERTQTGDANDSMEELGTTHVLTRSGGTVI